MSNDTNTSTADTDKPMAGQPVKVTNIKVETLLLPPQVIVEASNGLFNKTTYPPYLTVLEPWKKHGLLEKNHEYRVTFDENGKPQPAKTMKYDHEDKDKNLIFVMVL